MPFPQYTSIYQERGLLTPEGKVIKNKQEISNLMKLAIVSISHCPGHQKGRNTVAQGNNQADHLAQEVNMQEPILIMDLQETSTGEWEINQWLHGVQDGFFFHRVLAPVNNPSSQPSLTIVERGVLYMIQTANLCLG